MHLLKYSSLHASVQKSKYEQTFLSLFRWFITKYNFIVSLVIDY